MSRIQVKTTLHTKDQDKHKLNDKRQTMGANSEMPRILELSDMDFKAGIIKCPHLTTMNTLKTTEN